MNYHKTPERAPFITGEETRTFKPAEWRAMVAGLNLDPRVRKAARAVLVDRQGYVEAARQLKESAAYVRSATLHVQQRLGLVGEAAFQMPPSQRLVVDGVPPELHKHCRDMVLGLVEAWRARGIDAIWDSPMDGPSEQT